MKNLEVLYLTITSREQRQRKKNENHLQKTEIKTIKKTKQKYTHC